MPLGLVPEAYAVWYWNASGAPNILSVENNPLILTSYEAAKTAAENYIATLQAANIPVPRYIWISDMQKLWVDGET